LAMGRHGGQAPEIDGVVLLEKCPAGLEAGALVKARVTGYRDYDLVAALTGAVVGAKKSTGDKGPRVSLPVISSLEARGKRG
jgi:hypothetical protein